jgi:RecG-like helicase
VYEKITSQETLHTSRIVPAYHLTANITQKQIRFLIRKSCKYLELIKDWIPDKILKK